MIIKWYSTTISAIYISFTCIHFTFNFNWSRWNTSKPFVNSWGKRGIWNSYNSSFRYNHRHNWSAFYRYHFEAFRKSRNCGLCSLSVYIRGHDFRYQKRSGRSSLKRDFREIQTVQICEGHLLLPDSHVLQTEWAYSAIGVLQLFMDIQSYKENLAQSKFSNSVPPLFY